MTRTDYKNNPLQKTDLEAKVERVVTPFMELIQDQTTASVLLLVCTVAAPVSAKTGILFESLVAGLCGYLWLRFRA